MDRQASSTTTDLLGDLNREAQLEFTLRYITHIWENSWLCGVATMAISDDMSWIGKTDARLVGRILKEMAQSDA